MTNQNDIFKRLAEYEVNPPDEIWSLIKRSIESSAGSADDVSRGSLAAVQDFVVAPPAEAFLAIARKVEDPFGFYELHDFEQAPPKNITQRVFEAITAGKSKQQPQQSIVRKLYEYRLTAAASVILLFIAGWLLYKSFINKENLAEKTVVVKKETPVLPVEKDSSLQLVTTTKDEAIKKIKTISIKQSPFSIGTVMIGEYSYKFNFTDNDMLASFANFTYATAPPFITDEKEAKPFFIQVDQFTAIAVSEPMAGMMKRMNTFRKNGRPTPRAKRERRRLESWKKADEKRFDAKMSANPLDPIDLAEFIFH